MSFKILEQKFGTSVKTIIFELETKIKVNDFCFVKDKGFIIAMDNGVSLLTHDNDFISSWVAHVHNPKSIYFQEKNKNVYVIDGYSSVKRFSLNNPYAFEVMGDRGKATLNNYFSKIKDKEYIVDCSATSSGEIYFTNDKVNRCFRINNAEIEVLVGNGRSGFSIATKLDQCQLNAPSGVCCYNGNVYISDTQNKCIRMVSKNKSIKTIFGKPETSGEGGLDAPSKMIIKGNLIYFIDNNKIKYSTMDATDTGVIYKPQDPKNNIVSLDIGRDKLLYVLSEV
ncbi:hypothetical protein D4R86_02980 [bacterium]|nr:MAG: hypothetical protein D4R86_02980 [bacterium]